MIPDKSQKTVFFSAIGETSYEMFFYAYMEGVPVQCFTLAEDNQLDENELAKVFESVAYIIKESKLYNSEKINIATIVVDKSGIKLNMEYEEKNAGMYEIKKEWKQKNLVE